MLECSKDICQQGYIGQSKRPLKYCLADHWGYIVNQHINKATGTHYNLPGHCLAYLGVTVLDQVKINSDNYLKEHKKYTSAKGSTHFMKD